MEVLRCCCNIKLVVILYSETETVTITGLRPFTEYKFSVFSSNKALYNVTSCRTSESCKSHICRLCHFFHLS